ncbi:hypothetical protein SKAU_G00154500 [Synaphobranchus kaupii]|uniref:Uncharacterized protein n=1 Tax=Synaphobranchus kaupii TaxID=118154 RepID=A0A9Q1FHU8_SYNKA|nr:hypothetical protein SKAU_G00154500 [Synaphobranchus kaupii]
MRNRTRVRTKQPISDHLREVVSGRFQNSRAKARSEESYSRCSVAIPLCPLRVAHRQDRKCALQQEVRHKGETPTGSAATWDFKQRQARAGERFSFWAFEGGPSRTAAPRASAQGLQAA